MKPSEFWKDGHTEREFEESGLQCCTRTIIMGHRCGYVALPKGHPLFGKGWDTCYDVAPDLDVDGGVTFADGTDDMWILGWDAAHCWHRPDPSIMNNSYKAIYERCSVIFEPNAVMIDADMAEQETRRFARQLAALHGEEETTVADLTKVVSVDPPDTEEKYILNSFKEWGWTLMMFLYLNECFIEDLQKLQQETANRKAFEEYAKSCPHLELDNDGRATHHICRHPARDDLSDWVMCDVDLCPYSVKRIEACNTRATLESGTCENEAKSWGEFECSECGFYADFGSDLHRVHLCPDCGKALNK